MSLVWSLLFKDPAIILSTIFMGSLSVACSFFDSQGNKQHAISQAWARMLLRIGGVTVRIRGIENVDPAQNYLFAGNHRSLYDTPVVLGSIPQQFLFLVNQRYVRLPFLGTHLRRAGHFSVDSNDIRSSLKIMTEAAKRIQERKLSVVLFPEGSRARDGVQQFKEGAAYIAIKAQVPVIPFALRGTREVLPIGSVHVRGLPVDFIIGKPISTSGMTLKDRQRLTSEMRNRVADLLEAAGS